jgi:CRISP-associated protein Cas1
MWERRPTAYKAERLSLTLLDVSDGPATEVLRSRRPISPIAGLTTMIKRTIEISQQAVHLTVRDEQLLILGKAEPPKALPAEPEGLLASIPCEDVGLILVEHNGTTYTHAALTTLLRYDAAVVVCGRNHLPAGLLLPFGEHTQVVWRIHDQLAVKKPLQKQLWRQLVQAKIRAQAANLRAGSAVRSRLLSLAREVRSGDPSNVEAQAARAYWSALFGETFRRDADAGGLNALLNYGYAVVRAAVARAIVAAGLLPALGLHHANRSDAFCLADDLMEPLRPLIDVIVRAVWANGATELNPKTKEALLRVLTAEVRCDGQTGPLMVALHRCVASLVHCYEGTAKRLDIPVACDAGSDSAETEAGPP